jgi:peptide/nickel transport system permease protein
MLPAFAIALPKIAMTFKFLRSSIIEQKASDYVATAKSHGLSDIKIMFRHILPNSNVSSITVISLVLSDILGGSLIVEQVFNLPGLGRLLLSAISQRDFPLLSGIVFYLALVTVLLYFAADIFSSLSDPRIRLR